MKRRPSFHCTEDTATGSPYRVWSQLAAWQRTAWTAALLMDPGVLVIDGYTTYNRGFDLFIFANVKLRSPGDPWFTEPPEGIIDYLAGQQNYYADKAKRIPPEWII